MDKNGFTKARYKQLDTYKECQKIAVKALKVIDDIPAFYDDLRYAVEGV